MSRLGERAHTQVRRFVLLFPPIGQAQERGILLLSADRLEENDPVDLSYVLWRYHAGDSLVWAETSHDDSGWILLKPTVDLDSIPEGTWTGIGWFRLHLVVDSTLRNSTLALSMDHLGASEIYLDGKLVHRFGTVGSSKAEERIGYPLQIPIGLHLDGRAEHLLAVRYSFLKGVKLFSRYGDLFDLKVGFFIWLAELNNQISTYVDDFNLVIGVSGVFSFGPCGVSRMEHGSSGSGCWGLFSRSG